MAPGHCRVGKRVTPPTSSSIPLFSSTPSDADVVAFPPHSPDDSFLGDAGSEFCLSVLSSEPFDSLPVVDSFQSVVALDCSRSDVLHESLLLLPYDDALPLCQQVRDVLASVLKECSVSSFGMSCSLTSVVHLAAMPLPLPPVLVSSYYGVLGDSWTDDIAAGGVPMYFSFSGAFSSCSTRSFRRCVHAAAKAVVEKLHWVQFLDSFSPISSAVISRRRCRLRQRPCSTASVVLPAPDVGCPSSVLHRQLLSAVSFDSATSADDLVGFVPFLVFGVWVAFVDDISRLLFGHAVYFSVDLLIVLLFFVAVGWLVSWCIFSVSVGSTSSSICVFDLCPCAYPAWMHGAQALQVHWSAIPLIYVMIK